MNTSTALRINGTLHPHVTKLSPEIIVIQEIAAVPSNIPIVTPVCGILPKNPFLSFGAYSTASSKAPPHSPPIPSP